MTDYRTTRDADIAEIDRIAHAFFEAFRTGDGADERFAALRALFLPHAVIVRTCGLDPVAYDVDSFIEPRAKLLTSGTLSEFEEHAVEGRVDLFGDIAQWFGSYAKSGVQDGAPLTGRGMKSIQLVRTVDGWRISGAAWDDEREGLSID